jgi:lipopolysaccharide export system protein LptA
VNRSFFKGIAVNRTAAGCALAGLALLLVLTGADAQEAASTERIQVRADRLVADQGSQYAEFSGNVRASQGNTVITCDQLRIHYAADAVEDSGETGDPIEKIVAEGNVTIQFDDKVAQTDQATYTTRDRVLVLSGETSRVTSGKDAISGSKIVVDRISQRIRVESGEKPVEAVFYPAGKGLD